MGPFPAATLTNIALGIPHAHVKHPPSGPPPIPPIPLPPLRPIMLGTNLTVLINNKPTARCGDYGLNPTCCGVVPPLAALYEIVTGSSSVYIGGSVWRDQVSISQCTVSKCPRQKCRSNWVSWQASRARWERRPALRAKSLSCGQSRRNRGHGGSGQRDRFFFRGGRSE